MAGKMITLARFIFLWNLFCVTVAITRHCDSATGRCYWMSNAGNADWATARTNCQSQGGDLAVIETGELWDFVMSKFK